MMAHNNKNNDNDKDDEVISQDDFQGSYDEIYVKFFKVIKELKACKKTSKTNLKRTNELIKENEALVEKK